MHCKDLRLSRHAVQRMFERGISVDEVRELVEVGETIERYAEDDPWPSRLLSLKTRDRALHAVVAEAPGEVCYIVTVYEPDPDRWDSEFRVRRRR